MKKTSLAVLSATILALVLVIGIPAYAQDDKPGKQDDKATQEDKSAQEDKAQDEKHPAAKQDESKPAQTEDKQTREEKSQETTTQQRETETQHTSARIPEAKFRANFGREHVFVINRPVIVAGVPRFQYGGYWFAIGQPWPTGWAYTDQVYVDYINGGYYLLSPVHPGVQISINVVL
jgi:hypothetical protein